MDTGLRKFSFRDLQTIEGYIDPPDALVFLSLLRAQKKSGLEGGIAEIGVFYGRSYFLLKKISDGDRILAIDLFDLDQTPDAASTQSARVIANGPRLGLAMNEELVIRGDSTLMRADEITRKVG